MDKTAQTIRDTGKIIGPHLRDKEYSQQSGIAADIQTNLPATRRAVELDIKAYPKQLSQNLLATSTVQL
jgi:hypothetical protein